MRYTLMIGALCVSLVTQLPALSFAQAASVDSCDCVRKHQSRVEESHAESTIADAEQPENVPAVPSPPAAEQAVLNAADLNIFLQLINDLRAQTNLDPLQYDTELSVMAQDWSDTMARTEEFKHSDYPVFENIAQSMPDASVQQVYDMWENSPDHKSNMVSERVRFLGLGADETRTYWTLVMTGAQ